ncbi:hypothetical protein TNCV_1480181 [Trichonephila clavipes]|nr:hypothetical protein TNCV_1480181 [Trichonephila clavipes]
MRTKPELVPDRLNLHATKTRSSFNINWADIENYVEFSSKVMPGIKIDDNCLFEAERRLSVCLNSNELEQLENQHAEKLVKDG